MRSASLKIAAAVLLAFASYYVGRWQTAPPAQAVAPSRKVLSYRCPMHPQYTSDRPGDAPCCGMRLEPVYADGKSPANLPPGAFEVPLDKQQLIGVRFEPALLTPGTETLRAFGRLLSIQDNILAITADVYEYDASRIYMGQRATVSEAYGAARSFSAAVDYISPRLDATTRTLRVRLSAPAPAFPIVPETYLNVDFRIDGPTALAIPSTAVLDAGVRKTVFVDLGNGYLEPRRVRTGRRLSDGRLEILNGLRKDERVAVSATFLLDSEAQLKAPSGRRDPVCGMTVNPAKAAGRSRFEEEYYFFCSKDCKRKFDAAPRQFLRDLHPTTPTTASTTATTTPSTTRTTATLGGATARERTDPPKPAHRDPICGMPVSATNERRRVAEFRDIKLYFCSEQCWKEFVSNPELYGQKHLAASGAHD